MTKQKKYGLNIFELQAKYRNDAIKALEKAKKLEEKKRKQGAKYKPEGIRGFVLKLIKKDEN